MATGYSLFSWAIPFSHGLLLFLMGYSLFSESCPHADQCTSDHDMLSAHIKTVSSMQTDLPGKLLDTQDLAIAWKNPRTLEKQLLWHR